MFKGLITSFVLDYGAKIIHSLLLIAVSHSYFTGDNVTTLEAGAGILLTTAVTAILKILTAGKVASNAIATTVSSK